MDERCLARTRSGHQSGMGLGAGSAAVTRALASIDVILLMSECVDPRPLHLRESEKNWRSSPITCSGPGSSSQRSGEISIERRTRIHRLRSPSLQCIGECANCMMEPINSETVRRHPERNSQAGAPMPYEHQIQSLRETWSPHQHVDKAPGCLRTGRRIVVVYVPYLAAVQ